MRTFTTVLCVVALSGCSAIFDPGRLMGGDPRDGGGRDGGSRDAEPGDDAGPECTTAAECGGGTHVCDGGACIDCDGDGDGFFQAAAACDDLRADGPADCDDDRSDVHPGAPTVCGDGAINACLEVPADVSTSIGVAEMGVEDVVQLWIGAPDHGLQPLSMVALQSTGGERNAAVASRTIDAAGSFEAQVFPFDHTAPAPSTPIVPVPTARDYYFVRDVHVWQTGPTTATALVEGVVSEGGTTLGLPYFDAFGPGVSALDVDPVESDRARCDYVEIDRSARSARGDWFAFIGRNQARTVYSLHAVSAGGVIDCIPDLDAAGVAITEFPSIIAAGDVVFVTSDVTGETFVWKPGGLSGPQLYAPGFSGGLAEPPIITVGIYEYLVAQSVGEMSTLHHLDCNQSGGCIQLNTHVIPAAPGYARELTRWGSGAAVVTRFDDAPIEGSTMLRQGLEVRLVDATGAGLGGDAFALYPFEDVYDRAARGARIEWYAAASVPRVAGGDSADLLVAFTLRRADSTESLELARIRGCVEP